MLREYLACADTAWSAPAVVWRDRHGKVGARAVKTSIIWRPYFRPHHDKCIARGTTARVVSGIILELCHQAKRSLIRFSSLYT
jgi:hypothetical protein